jgi:hypothetical protein
MIKPTLESFDVFYLASQKFLHQLSDYWSNHASMPEEEARRINKCLTIESSKLEGLEVYLWLKRQASLKNALEVFKHPKYKDIFIFIAGHALSLYERTHINSERLRANTKKDRSNTYKQARKLYGSLAANNHIPPALFDPDENKQLLALLSKLIDQLDKKTDNPLTKRKLKKPAERLYIEHLFSWFYRLFGDYMTESVIRLVGLLEDELSIEAVRLIKKDLIKQMKDF